jgi:Type II secretion system (T2SS), protein E, N-terminal domain
MSVDRLFGELLGRLVPLSSHDVCEILEEQSGSRLRFGQIALSWGLCEARHVWHAWATQLHGRTPRIDLLKTGIDAQATLQLPAPLAAKLGIIPVRSIDGRLIVAASEETLADAAEALATADFSREVHFVLSDPRQIEQAIRTYYGQWLGETTGETCARPCRGRCNGVSCPQPSEIMAARSSRLCEASSPAVEVAATAFATAFPQAAPRRPSPRPEPAQSAV